MTCHWIIENLVKEKSYTDLAEEVKKQGFPLQLINGDFKFADLKHENQCVIFNGSIEMSKMIWERLRLQGCFPISYATQEKYLCSQYYPHFQQYLFNDKHCLLSLEALNQQKYFWYGVLGKECLLFVRPDRGDKTFKAGLVDLQEFDSFYKEFEHLKNELVLISTPKNIKGEWRFVVSDSLEIIAVSSYRYQGQITRIPSAPVGATKLVEKLLKVNYYPDSVFCYDIAEDGDGNFWLMELTSFSSAGLYECNKQQIVEKVSKIALQDWQMDNILR